MFLASRRVHPARVVPLAVSLTAVLFVSTGCQPGGSTPGPSASVTPTSSAPAGTPGTPEPTTPATSSGDSNYAFKRLGMGGTGFVTGLVAHPSAPGVIYAREDVGGLVRWDEASQTWTQLLRADRVPNPTPADYGGESIAVAPSNDKVVFAAVGTGDKGRILTSTDRGEHWKDGGFRTDIEGNNDYRTGPERLRIDPANEKVAYFGSRTGGLFTSADQGNSWKAVSAVPAGDVAKKVGVPFVLFDPSSGTADGRTKRIWAGVSGQGIYLSEDAGSSWKNVHPSTETLTDAKIADDGTLYVSFATTLRAFTPANTAGTDVTAPTSRGSFYFGVDPHDSKRLVATSGAVSPGNLVRSLDGGKTWDDLTFTLAAAEIKWPLKTNEGGYMSAGTFVVDPTVKGRVWFPQGVGVWRSDDIFGAGKAVTWNFISKGIEEAVTNDLIAPAGGAPISAIMDRNGFRHTNVDGFPDQTILNDKFSDGTSLAYAANKPNYMVAISSDTRAQYQPFNTEWTTAPSSGYSTDGGVTWTPFGGDKSQIAELYGGNVAVSSDASSIVWQPSIAGPFQDKAQNVPHFSTDNGKTWTKSTGVDPGLGIHNMIWWGSKRALDADSVTPGTYYLYTTRNHGEFFRSTDGGHTWTKTKGTAPSADANDSHVFGQIHAEPGKAGHVWSSNAQGGLSYTTDGGSSWTKVKAVQEAKSFGFGKAASGTVPMVYANAKINDRWGVWRSDDEGATWKIIDQFPGSYYTTISVVTGDMNKANRVYVCFNTNGCVYGDPR